MTISISNSQARHLILHLQGLTQPPHLKFSPDGLYRLIEMMGFVQLDSIQWVERAQHMTMFARNQTYRPKDLAQLLEKDKLLFENWTHDASVIPSQFFPYWRQKFEREKQTIGKKIQNWQGGGFVEHCPELLARIDQHGGLMSRDLERKELNKPEMWQWHDGKAALEYLWRVGDLCITQRKGFQKVYDLTERGLLSKDFDAQVSHDEFLDWACRSALDRLGFGAAGDIARYWDLVKPAEARDWLEDQGTNSVVPVEVSGHNKGEVKTLSARADIASVLDGMLEVPKRVRALSPFDPVIRDRKRLSWLFGFDYRIEIYVPEAKRQWGYYVYPLLEGSRLIGRIDMRAQRKQNCLEVKRLWLEPKQKLTDARRKRLDQELLRQTRLTKMSSVVWLESAEQDLANLA